MEGRRDTGDDAARVHAEILRSIPGAERVRMAVALTEEVHRIARAGIASRHPEYSAEAVHLAFIRVLLGDDLFAAALPGQELLAP